MALVADIARAGGNDFIACVFVDIDSDIDWILLIFSAGNVLADGLCLISIRGRHTFGLPGWHLNRS